MAKEHLTVKHYLKTLEETVRQQWNQKALCDFGGDAFTYADVATSLNSSAPLPTSHCLSTAKSTKWYLWTNLLKRPQR